MNYPHYPLPFSLLRVFSCLLLGFVAGSNLQAQGSESTEVPPNPQLVKAQPTPTPGSIRGRVFYADTRRPVRHAGIYLAAIIDDAEYSDEDSPPEIPNTVADMNGDFRFPKVPPGRYVVYPNDGGLVLLSNYPDSDSSLAERIRNGSLTEGFAEIYVKSGLETKVELTGRRSAAITGRVLYSDGSPVPGANILIFRPGDKETLTQVTSGLTDSRGIYRVSNLPGGKYIVAAHDRNVEANSDQDQKQAYSSGLLVSAYYPSAKASRLAKPVQVPDGGDTENIDVTLPDPQMRNISGTVELKIKSRPPLARVKVQLIPLENEPGQAPQPSPLFTSNRERENYTVFSDDTGSWNISGVPEGFYQLRFDGDISTIAKPSDTSDTPGRDGESRKSGALSAIHRHKLHALIPILHQALLATWAHTSMAAVQQRRQQFNNLTDRQAEILHWVAQGKANGEIAQILALSEYTVKNHLKLILQKLGAANRTQAAKAFSMLGSRQIEDTTAVFLK